MGRVSRPLVDAETVQTFRAFRRAAQAWMECKDASEAPPLWAEVERLKARGLRAEARMEAILRGHKRVPKLLPAEVAA